MLLYGRSFPVGIMAESLTMPQIGQNHFERLGLPQRFALDAPEVERNYLTRSRESHPDFHGMASHEEQQASLQLSAALNEAYATLREPFRRAEYLLQLEGGPSAAEHKEMAPAFLEEMLDLRMEIEELRGGVDRDAAGIVSMEQQLNKRRDVLIGDLACHFAQIESPSAAAGTKRDLLLQIRQTLNAAKYIQGLLRDLRAD
jgi:molecular chaperone HscB